MKKSKNIKKNGKKKLTAVICGALAVLIVAGAMIWMRRDKDNGIYSWAGFKMDADEILYLKYDTGDGEKVFTVPFSEYRAVYLYYKNRVPGYYVYQTSDSTSGSDDNTQYIIFNDSDKNRAVREVTEEELVSYYSLLALADELGVGLTEKDREEYRAEYDEKIAEYAATIGDDVKYRGTKEEYAKELYEKSFERLGFNSDYFEMTYYKSLIRKRVKALLGRDIESTINEGYYAFKEVLVSYTKGDTADEERARKAIEDAYARIGRGESIEALMTEYNNGSSTEPTYFDAFGNVVGTSTGEVLGETITEMVRALDYGEHSSIMNGDSDDIYAYYSIIERVKITEDFVCGESPEAAAIYQYPYVGASSYSSAYSDYLTYIDIYEQNMSPVPVNDKVYSRIALNTLY